MAKKIEVNYPTDDCPSCGRQEATVITEAKQDKDYVWVNDGDIATCNHCGHTGVVSVEDSECADVVWDEIIRPFKKAFHLPFKEIHGTLMDSEMNMVANMLMDDDKFNKLIVLIINGKSIPISSLWHHDNEYIYLDDKKIMLIRGWGYLTGIGGLNLPVAKAAEIQDDLADFIVEQLNSQNKNNA